MKVPQTKRFKILVAILIACAILAGIFFVAKDSIFQTYSDDIEIEYSSLDWSNYGYPPYGLYPENYDSGIDSRNEEIFRNITLKSNNPNLFYSFLVRDYISIENSTNKTFVYDPALMEKTQAPSSDFYSLEIRTENNSIVHKLQDMNAGNIYEKIIAEYWILSEGMDPKASIELLVATSKDSEIIKSGACEVVELNEMTSPDSEGTSGIIPDKNYYKVEFKPEKLPTELLNKYSNRSTIDFCGKYGQVANSYGTTDSGNFFFSNDVLIFFPIGSMWQWSFMEESTKIIKR